MESFSAFVDFLNGIAWGPWMLVLLVGTGIFLSSKMGFIQFTRFGYATLRADSDSLLFEAGDEARVHEFHYWDADDPGDALEAVKPSGRRWRCAHVSDTLYAGFPHLYFPGCPKAARRFIQKCLERKNAR